MFWNDSATRRSWRPVVARCDEGEDHGTTCFDRDLSCGNDSLHHGRRSVLALDEPRSTAQRPRAAEAIETNRRMSEALSQSQAANQEMLKQMREMSQSVLHPVSPDWNPVTFKLTEETAAGPPAAGFSLVLTRLDGLAATSQGRDPMELGTGPLTASLLNSARRQLRVVLPPAVLAHQAMGQFGGMGGMGGGMGGMAKSIQRTSDAAGLVDCGSVPPGDYTFRITKPWPEGSLSATGQLNVGPGSKVQKTIVCPKTPPEHATVRVHWAWPADLAKEQLVLYAPFAYRYRKLEPGLEWSLTDTPSPQRPRRRRNFGMFGNQFPGQPALRLVLCGPVMTVTDIARFRRLFLWRHDEAEVDDAAQNPEQQKRGGGRGGMGGGFAGGGQGYRTARLGPGDWADILLEDLQEIRLATDSPEPRELSWELGTYGLDQLIVLRPTRSLPVEPGRRRFDVIAASFVNGTGPAVHPRDVPPDKQDFATASAQGFDGMMGAMGGFRSVGLSEQRAVGPNEQWMVAASTVDLPTDYWDKVDVAFEARRGQVNDWTIPLPDELIKAVRAAAQGRAVGKDQSTSSRCTGQRRRMIPWTFAKLFRRSCRRLEMTSRRVYGEISSTS